MKKWVCFCCDSRHSHLLELQTALDDAQELPRTLAVLTELDRLLTFVERMKQSGDVLCVDIGKNGEGFKQFGNFGSEFKRLMSCRKRQRGE